MARDVRLYAYPDEERLVVVASWAGGEHDPQWAHNLRSNPRALVKQGSQTREVVAREVDGRERGRLWSLVTSAFPLYQTYQDRTERVIPLFVLSTDGHV
jgi:deazaflavin-dependent oxidoreductase (nitroreductase family)